MTGRLAVPRILWAALFVSTLLYVAALELTTVSGEADWQVLLLPLASAGAMVGGGSLAAPRMLLRQRSANATEESSSTEAAGGYLVALILSMALAESVAIFALVLALRGAPLTVVMPFFVVTWILMLIRFPTQEKLDEFHG